TGSVPSAGGGAALAPSPKSARVKRRGSSAVAAAMRRSASTQSLPTAISGQAAAAGPTIATSQRARPMASRSASTEAGPPPAASAAAPTADLGHGGGGRSDASHEPALATDGVEVGEHRGGPTHRGAPQLLDGPGQLEPGAEPGSRSAADGDPARGARRGAQELPPANGQVGATNGAHPALPSLPRRLDLPEELEGTPHDPIRSRAQGRGAGQQRPNQSDQVRIDVRGRQGELRAASARRLAARENGEGGAERVEVTEPSIAGGRSLDRLGSEVAARAPGGLHLRGGGGEPE